MERERKGKGSAGRGVSWIHGPLRVKGLVGGETTVTGGGKKKKNLKRSRGERKNSNEKKNQKSPRSGGEFKTQTSGEIVYEERGQQKTTGGGKDYRKKLGVKGSLWITIRTTGRESREGLKRGGW